MMMRRSRRSSSRSSRWAVGIRDRRRGDAARRGEGENAQAVLQSRIANTKKLLKTAALIMSVLLIGSAVVTATMIPADALKAGGHADGRALAYWHTAISASGSARSTTA
jgi:hypothetical protein